MYTHFFISFIVPENINTLKVFFIVSIIFKIHVRRAANRGYSNFPLYMCVCFYLFVYLFMCVTPPNQTKNYTDLKFGTDPLLDQIWNRVFRFFEKVTLRAASLEKVQCHVDFPHISSIASSFILLLFIIYKYCHLYKYLQISIIMCQ